MPIIEYRDMPEGSIIPAQEVTLSPEKTQLTLDVIRNINSIVTGAVSAPLDSERLEALMGEIKDELERLK